MTGVEGYVESAASGFLVGVETARRLAGLPPVDFPQETAIGALGLYVSDESVTAFPAHEHQLRHHSAPGLPGEGEAEQECGAVPAQSLEHDRQLLQKTEIWNHMKIIVDAMGGDNAPLEIGPGRPGRPIRPTGWTSCWWAGPRRCCGPWRTAGRRICPTGWRSPTPPRWWRSRDDPATAFKSKKDSSLTVGLNLLRDGEGDAFVSAGSTGALLAGATLVVKRIRGIRRAAMGPVIPRATAVSAVLCDCGANAECTPEYLLQFAYLGNFYAQRVLGDREAPGGAF